MLNRNVSTCWILKLHETKYQTSVWKLLFIFFIFKVNDAHENLHDIFKTRLTQLAVIIAAFAVAVA